jgi:hypothetical protein
MRLKIKIDRQEYMYCKLLWQDLYIRNDKARNSRTLTATITEATSLDWKSQYLENPSVPLLRLADKKSSIY